MQAVDDGATGIAPAGSAMLSTIARKSASIAVLDGSARQLE
jgi:hypothetical protein